MRHEVGFGSITADGLPETLIRRAEKQYRNEKSCVLYVLVSKYIPDLGS